MANKFNTNNLFFLRITAIYSSASARKWVIIYLLLYQQKSPPVVQNQKNNNTKNLTFPTLNPILVIQDLHVTDLLRTALQALKGVSGIYCITCSVTGAMYIGSAVDLSKRLAEGA